MVVRVPISGVALAVALLGVAAAPVLAQEATAPAVAAVPAVAASVPAVAAAPTGGCLIAPAAVPDKDVQDFLKDPAALLTNFPLGGVDMTRQVRGLAATDAKTIQPLMDDAKAGTQLHKVAIASGLGAAAVACVRVRADISLFIQQKVAGFDDKSFVDAFLVSTSNVATAATGAGGNGAGGIGGAVGAALGGSGGAGNGTANGNFTTANTTATFSFGGAGAVSDTVNNSVSQ